MSMPVIKMPEDPINRCQAINNLIESVALVETGLSHIINAEGEKIQKVVNWDKEIDVPVEDIIKVNESVNKMITSITKLEMILQNKLEIVSELDIKWIK